jgi:hypothetical protein
MSVNLINKKKEISKVSNENIVIQKAQLLLDEEFDLDYSTRKNKKFMIKGEFTNNKWVHFGDINYPDYTFTNDEEKRNKFLKIIGFKKIRSIVLLGLHIIYYGKYIYPNSKFQNLKYNI